jgi:hypothetical protein
VRPAERRKKIIEGHLVGDVEGRKSQGELLAIRAEQIVRPNTEIEEVARGDTWRIGVVVFSAISGDAYSQRSVICRVVKKGSRA